MTRNEFLTMKEVANLLRVSTRTIHRYVKAGKITVAFRMNGTGQLRFRAEQVLAEIPGVPANRR